MKTNIYLVRHAHSIYSEDELGRPLSNIGHQMVSKVTNLLINHNIHKIISSPYKRAIQTIENLALTINKEIEIVEGFRERKLGELKDIDFMEALKQVWTDSSFSFPLGESNLIAQKRGIIALNTILNNYQGKNIVIGTHGNIMVLIMNYFNNKIGLEFWKQLKMPDIYQLSFEDNIFIQQTKIWTND
ncbi:histidine phosphatase family protein [Mycoplasmatota bacterium]|nr:histidine phosphatase family protein [Mycoplasmatota bacterium]